MASCALLVAGGATGACFFSGLGAAGSLHARSITGFSAAGLGAAAGFCATARSAGAGFSVATFLPGAGIGARAGFSG